MSAAAGLGLRASLLSIAVPPPESETLLGFRFVASAAAGSGNFSGLSLEFLLLLGRVRECGGGGVMFILFFAMLSLSRAG